MPPERRLQLGATLGVALTRKGSANSMALPCHEGCRDNRRYCNCRFAPTTVLPCISPSAIAAMLGPCFHHHPAVIEQISPMIGRFG
jgi:hypothetical protein